MNILQYFINGISIGSVYAIIALGYTMVYGIAKMLNFAHGDVIMVGAYICYCVTVYLGLPVLAGVLLSMVVCTVLGITIEGLAYKPLRGTPSLAVLITAIGVSYFLQNAAQLIWSSNPKSFTSIVSNMKPLHLFGSLTITGEVIVTVAVLCVVSFCAGYWSGKLLRQDYPTLVTMTLNTGLRNISAGAVLAAQYFPADVLFPVALTPLFLQVMASLVIRVLQSTKPGRAYAAQLAQKSDP